MKLNIEIEIEKGIPIPYIRRTFDAALWSKMENGDSFKVPDERIRNCAITAGKRLGHKVTSEKINGGGYRVWLVTKGVK